MTRNWRVKNLFLFAFLGKPMGDFWEGFWRLFPFWGKLLGVFPGECQGKEGEGGMSEIFSYVSRLSAAFGVAFPCRKLAGCSWLCWIIRIREFYQSWGRKRQDMAFSFIKAQIDRDSHQKYLQKCEQNRENAAKRWEPDANAYDRILQDAIHANTKTKKKTRTNTKTNLPLLSPKGDRPTEQAENVTV